MKITKLMAIAAITLPVLATAGLSEPTGYTVEYQDFQQTLDNDTKVDSRKNITTKAFYEREGELSGNFVTNYYSDIGAILGRYKNQLADDNKTLFGLTTEHRATIGFDSGNGFVPEAGLELKGRYMTVGNRLDAQVAALVGISYMTDKDGKVGLRYGRTLAHYFYYPDYDGIGGQDDDVRLQQNKGNNYQLFAETVKNSRTYGVALGYSDAKQGKAKRLENGNEAFEAKNREYTLGMYFKY